MANPFSAIFAATVKTFESIATVVDTAASATDAGMKALNLHATEYYKRVEYDYADDFQLYKLERDNANKERLEAVIAKQHKLAAKLSELETVPQATLDAAEAVFKMEMERAAKL